MTAVTEILEHCKKLISEGHEIDTQGLVHWIEDKLLEMEKEQIMKAVYDSMGTNLDPNMGRAEQYYNETFKNK
jgi:hypothetical protein